MTGELRYGKYRGVVTDANDPSRLGRIKARVAGVLGDQETGWAAPCVPFAGAGMGMFALPADGAGVWIEFEGGDTDQPIWSGCWWGDTDMPSDVATPPQTGKVLLKTDGGCSILLDDTPGAGGITLTTSSGQKIVLGSQGIEIDNGSGATIKLSGPQVSINGGALEVT